MLLLDRDRLPFWPVELEVRRFQIIYKTLAKRFSFIFSLETMFNKAEQARMLCTGAAIQCIKFIVV